MKTDGFLMKGVLSIMNRICIKAAWSLIVLFPLVVVWGSSLLLNKRCPPTGHQTVIAAVPFVILALFLQLKSRNNQNGIDKGPMFAFLSVLIPSTILWGWFYLDSLLGWSIGANIGLYLLIEASPFYLPLLMLFGYQIGTLIKYE